MMVDDDHSAGEIKGEQATEALASLVNLEQVIAKTERNHPVRETIVQLVQIGEILRMSHLLVNKQLPSVFSSTCDLKLLLPKFKLLLIAILLLRPCLLALRAIVSLRTSNWQQPARKTSPLWVQLDRQLK
jgi:hypothetical protein